MKEETFMRLPTKIATWTLLALAALTTAVAQEVQTDFDHETNFTQYKTYSWQQIKPANSLWDARIKRAVDAQLRAKGWAPIADGGDVSIVAIKMIEKQKSLETFYDSFGDGYGDGWGWRGWGDSFGDATTTEHDYKDGTLVIDMYDAKTKQLIWRGSVEDMLSNKAEKNEKSLKKGVAKMFRQFPPEPEKS
jgi:hypothetical protein